MEHKFEQEDIPLEVRQLSSETIKLIFSCARRSSKILQNHRFVDDDGGRRNDHEQRRPTSRPQKQYPQHSNHQLRLEEGVSPVRSSREEAKEYETRDRNRQDYQRNRYKD